MRKPIKMLITVVHFVAATLLVAFSVIIMGYSIYEVATSLGSVSNFIPAILRSVGAVIISAAIVDVAGYIVEEEVFKEKELRDPVEARKTITKIIVIITIAVSIEGLVFIFKAGTEDLRLLIYPTFLILSSAVLIVALGIYQKLSTAVEQQDAKS